MATRKPPGQMKAKATRTFLEEVPAPLWWVSLSVAVYRRTLHVQARYRYSA